MTTASTTSHDNIVNAIADEFRGTFSRETVAGVVDDTARRFDDAPVGTFVPTLIHRFARERLIATGHNLGVVAKTRPSVLFVCIHNAGRSQMAAALLERYAGDRVEVRSAGSEPSGAVHTGVVDAMAELGVSLERAYPKPLIDDVVQASDVVVTMGCGDACPVYPGTRYVDWDLADPAGKDVADVRAIRDEIDQRVRALADELLVGDRRLSGGHRVGSG